MTRYQDELIPERKLSCKRALISIINFNFSFIAVVVSTGGLNFLALLNLGRSREIEVASASTVVGLQT